MIEVAFPLRELPSYEVGHGGIEETTEEVSVSVRKRRMLVWVKGNLGKIKEILCYPKFKDSSFFTESLG